MRREPSPEDPSLSALGMAIRALRIDRKLSQEALGKKADIHPTWISHIESGKVNPKWGNVKRLSRALQVEFSELVAFADELELRMQSMAPPKD